MDEKRSSRLNTMRSLYYACVVAPLSLFMPMSYIEWPEFLKSIELPVTFILIFSSPFIKNLRVPWVACIRPQINAT